MKKRIAIIGSSPVMLIIAKYLSKKNLVIIFEKNKSIGGAWKIKKIKNFFFSNLHSNVIVPTKKKDENLFSKINKILSKFDIKIKRNFLRYEQNQNINFSKIYQYDFTNFFEKVKKNNKIVNKEIRTIKLINNKLIINKKTFDRVYIPFYNSINKIIINKKVLKIPYQKIKSQHIIAVSRKKFLKDIYYVENFSEFFDRAQVLNKKNFNIFIARISRIYKEKDLSFFIKKMFFIKRKDLIYVKKNSYMNYYRNKNQIKKIKKINNKKMIIVDTRSLFVSIKKYILQAGRNV